jgi:hypothetical protein
VDGHWRTPSCLILFRIFKRRIGWTHFGLKAQPVLADVLHHLAEQTQIVVGIATTLPGFTPKDHHLR